MKLYIPSYESYTGGPKTFLHNLTTYLSKNDVDVTKTPEQADIIFFPIEFDIEHLKRLKKKGRKIVQRLDGVYYESRYPDYKVLNSNIENIYLNYADFIVFQSEYSKRQCFEMFGPVPESKYTIIVNGADTQKFYPSEKEIDTEITKRKISFVTTGGFRSIEMLEPIVLALDSLENKYDFELKVVGGIKNPVLNELMKREYIVHFPEADLEKVGSELRNSDIMLFCYLNSSCPNSVVEAVASGIPVVAYDSGSLNEIAFFSKELLAPVSSETFQNYKDFKPEELAAKIELCISRYPEFKKKAVENASTWNLEKMGEDYINAFKTVSNSSNLLTRILNVFK
jgi:glycosyltransferase involved in cell wall biosynthesis